MRMKGGVGMPRAVSVRVWWISTAREGRQTESSLGGVGWAADDGFADGGGVRETPPPRILFVVFLVCFRVSKHKGSSYLGPSEGSKVLLL